MNRNLYCRISLALSIIFLLTKDVHALTVASDHEASPLQTLEAPSIEPHPNSEETTIRLFIYNPNERASTELYRSTSSTSGFQLIATLAPGASDVLANTTYHYTVNTVLENEGSPYLENVAEATVTTSGASTRCANVGSIERERWDNIPGLEISAIPTGTDPDKVTTLTSFEAPTNEGSNFGARIRGYICVSQPQVLRCNVKELQATMNVSRWS